jgi:superfamily II DNA helicase RecQ
VRQTASDPWETATILSIADTEIDEPIEIIDVDNGLDVGIRDTTIASSSRQPAQHQHYDQGASSRLPQARQRPSVEPRVEPDLDRDLESALADERVMAVQNQKQMDLAAAMREWQDVPMDDFFEASSPPPQLAPAGPAPAAKTPVTPNDSGKTHPWSREVAQKLKQVFKLTGFRENQKAAIDATMSGKDGKHSARLSDEY